MAEDDRRDRASSGNQTNSEVVLPAHASAYFSPRPPPALTQHRTIETEAVQFDPAVDPDLAETRRMQARSSEPPTWPDVEKPVANAPTVLVPVVRARRLRKRVVAGAIAALLGGGGGVLFGLLSESGPTAPTAPSASVKVTTRVATNAAARPASVPAPPVATSPTTTTTENAQPPNSARNPGQPAAEASMHEAAATAVSGTPRVARPAPKTSAWIKSEPPHAWIR